MGIRKKNPAGLQDLPGSLFQAPSLAILANCTSWRALRQDGVLEKLAEIFAPLLHNALPCGNNIYPITRLK